jgi:hypothetical protein
LRIFAYNTSSRSFRVFESEAEVIASCPGIEIAEGDWLFFSESGACLEAHFSVPASINAERNTYAAGVYTLRAGKGPALSQFLLDLCMSKPEPLHVWTFSEMDAYFQQP